MSISVNNWYFSPDHGQLCQVVESQTEIRTEVKGLSDE